MSARRLARAACPCLLALGLAACNTHPVDVLVPRTTHQLEKSYPQSLDKQVDLLFVIDNSPSMTQLQDQLAAQFKRLIDALRTPKLGNQIPDVRIGVVSTDLGAGPFVITDPAPGAKGCVPGGDGAKLLREAHVPGCTPPSDPWISYEGGKTNVAAGAADPVERVKEAFSCIARLGDGGCGFESPLEAARRALDPKQGVNPGFLRPEALLVVVFITNEDDCSARDASLFDTSQDALEAPLGFLHSFRCFEFGFKCDLSSRSATGPRKGCQPTDRYLHSVDSYASFFRGLKPAGRVLLATIAGPPEPVSVGKDGQKPVLQASCTASIGGKGVHGDPALRMKALTDGFGADGQFTSICASDYGPALQRLGARIVATLGGQCLGGSPLTRNGALACAKGDPLGGADYIGQPVSCRESCLDLADCNVEERSGWQSDAPSLLLPRCPAELFADAGRRDCGGSCPCWRLVKKSECASEAAPYALEVVRQGEAKVGTVARLTCATTPVQKLGALPQCH